MVIQYAERTPYACAGSPGELPLEMEVSMKASSCSSMLNSALPSSTAGAAEAGPVDACKADAISAENLFGASLYLNHPLQQQDALTKPTLAKGC